jgi:hypothetical protein
MFGNSARKSGSIWSVWAWRIFRRERRSGIVLNAGLRWALARREKLVLGGRRSDPDEGMGWRMWVWGAEVEIGARWMVLLV